MKYKNHNDVVNIDEVNIDGAFMDRIDKMPRLKQMYQVIDDMFNIVNIVNIMHPIER